MPANYRTSGTTDLDDVFLLKSFFNLPLNDSVLAWGQNSNNYPLGAGDPVNKLTPTFIPSLTNVDDLGDGLFVIKKDGTLWGWGPNDGGQLGLNDRVHRSSPVQIGLLTNWYKITSSGITFAIKTDGTLWSWGYNSEGQLGLGDITNRSSPVQVGALTDWSKVSAGSNHCLAIKTDGTLWSWGRNILGQLGLGDTTDRSSPTQVGALTNWSEISSRSNYSLAIKTDGTLWSWGYGGTFGAGGQLGLGDIIHRSSPVQVGALTNWSKLSTGIFSNFSLAIKTDGTLWAWGANNNSQLGLGDTTDRSSPVQVGSLTNWSKLSSGQDHCLAIKTDGTLWAWGSESGGRLGLGNTSGRQSVPVQVGSQTYWKSVFAYVSSSFGLVKFN